MSEWGGTFVIALSGTLDLWAVGRKSDWGGKLCRVTRRRRGRAKERSPLPWTGAPCSPQRTWAEDDGAQPLPPLSLIAETAVNSKSPCTWSESIRRTRFRPMYAGTNMGHPSNTNDRSLKPDTRQKLLI